MRHDHRAAIEAKLTPAELAYLRVYPVETWRIGGPAPRDYAVREARNVVAPNALPTIAARMLATELARYAASGWRHERHFASLPADVGGTKIVLHRVLRLSGGQTLGARRIFDICALVDECADAEISTESCIGSGA